MAAGEHSLPMHPTSSSSSFRSREMVSDNHSAYPTPEEISDTTIGQPCPADASSDSTIADRTHPVPLRDHNLYDVLETNTLPTYNFDHNGEPKLAFPNDQTGAAQHRHRVTTKPVINPYSDRTFFQVRAKREHYISDMIKAMYDQDSCVEIDNNIRERDQFNRNLPGHIDGYTVESACRAIFDALIFRCVHGFCGADRLIRPARSSMFRQEDLESSCEQRIKNVISTLRVSKCICRDVLMDDNKIRLLVHAPRSIMFFRLREKEANLRRRQKRRDNKTGLPSSLSLSSPSTPPQDGKVSEATMYSKQNENIVSVSYDSGGLCTRLLMYGVNDQNQTAPVQFSPELLHNELLDRSMGIELLDSRRLGDQVQELPYDQNTVDPSVAGIDAMTPQPSRGDVLNHDLYNDVAQSSLTGATSRHDVLNIDSQGPPNFGNPSIILTDELGQQTILSNQGNIPWENCIFDQYNTSTEGYRALVDAEMLEDGQSIDPQLFAQSYGVFPNGQSPSHNHGWNSGAEEKTFMNDV